MKSPLRSSDVRAWFNRRGKLHRLDGPAVEVDTGAKSWWRSGHRYRDNYEYLVEIPSGYRRNIAVEEMQTMDYLLDRFK